LDPREFSITFPDNLSVPAGPLSVTLVNDGLTVQLREATGGTTTLAIIDPYGPLTPLNFTSLSSPSAANAPEPSTWAMPLVALGVMPFLRRYV
jgi:hypothetical protein